MLIVRFQQKKLTDVPKILEVERHWSVFNLCKKKYVTNVYQIKKREFTELRKES